MYIVVQTDGLVQQRRNSSALALHRPIEIYFCESDAQGFLYYGVMVFCSK